MGKKYLTAILAFLAVTGFGTVSAFAAEMPKNNIEIAENEKSEQSYEITMGVGENVPLSEIIPDSVSVSEYQASSDSDIVEYDGKKMAVSALSCGTARIKFTNILGEDFSISVTVKKSVQKISISKKSVTLGRYEGFNLNPTVGNDEGTFRLNYKSDNPDIVEIKSSNGMIIPKACGKAKVTVSSYNGKSVSCDIVVKKSPTRIALNKTSLTLGVGEKYSLKSSLPSGEAAYRIVYTSSDSKVASVTSTEGLVTAKKPGTATVTAMTYNGKKVSCKITVKKAPTKIFLNKTSLTLGIGEKYDLNSSLPSGEGAYSIVYTSADSSIAPVAKAGGLVTAKRLGTTTVTATSYNGKKVSCKITVKKAPTKIFLNKTSLTLGIGEKYDLNSSLPSGEGAYSIVYTSADSSIAPVAKAGGLVTAKRLGTTTVTATSYNGRKVSCKITVKKAPTKISLNKRTLVLYAGEKYDLNSGLPSGEAAHSIVYTSADSGIASVAKAGGLVTAKKLGTTTVTATAYNGKKVSCTVAVVSKKNAVAVNGSVIKNKAAWSGKTIGSFKSGAKLNQISKSGCWIKVEYNGNIGYVYNKTFGTRSNYSSVNKNTLPIVVDDWLFSNGTGIKNIFNYCYSVGYSSLPKESMEDMCVRAIKMRMGACYHHAALLKYMLERAGYSSIYVEGIDKYTGGGPHAWTMVKTNDGWRHIDATQVRGLQTFYLVKDSVISPYFKWDRSKYPAAK